MPSRPPESSLRAFGLPADDLELLPGGQGTSFRSGDAVLKPAEADGVGEWLADLWDDIAARRPRGFRVPVHRRSRTGDAVVDGWVCTTLLHGDHRLADADWPRAVAVAREFCAALAEVDRPLPTTRPSCWSAADGMTWGEVGAPTWSGPAAPLVQRLTAGLHPVDEPVQLVHGDLAGNLLWSDDTPPAVIDLSPYRRPAGWATALVVVDAVLWYGADADELLGSLHEQERGQLLLRALLFRLMSSELLSQQPAGPPGPRPTNDDLMREAARAASLLAALR